MAEQLAEIGLEVEIRPFAEWTTTSAYLGRLGNPDEPWDMALVLWTPDFVDPYAYINRLLDTQDAGGTNLARFDEPEYIAADAACGAPAAAPTAARHTPSSTSNSHETPLRSFRSSSSTRRHSSRRASGCMLLRARASC